MISRNLSRRIDRLERRLRPRIKEMTASDIEMIRRLYEAKKRLGLPGWEALAPSRTLLKSSKITKESLNIEIIQSLQAGRTRNHENKLACQAAAAAAAAMEEIEITEA